MLCHFLAKHLHKSLSPRLGIVVVRLLCYPFILFFFVSIVVLLCIVTITCDYFLLLVVADPYYTHHSLLVWVLIRIHNTSLIFNDFISLSFVVIVHHSLTSSTIVHHHAIITSVIIAQPFTTLVFQMDPPSRSLSPIIVISPCRSSNITVASLSLDLPQLWFSPSSFF